MVDKFKGKYLYLKRDVFYFSKQIPKDMRPHYTRERLVICPKTKCPKEAIHLSQSMLCKLHNYWFALRIYHSKNPAQTILLDAPMVANQSNIPTLSESLATYFKLKGAGKGEIFFRASRRAVRDVIALLKDRPLDTYSTSDAGIRR